MKHPTSEEWMAFLYHEDTPAKHAELHAHAQECSNCAGLLRAWSGGRQVLDQWPIRREEGARAPQRPLLKMAAVAVLLLVAGIAIGRGLQQPSAEWTRLKSEVLTEFDQRLAAITATQDTGFRQIVADLAQSQDERRAVERDATIAAIRQLENRYATQLAALRSELETVALNTEGSLIETRQKLGLLALSAQPDPTRPQ